LVFWNEKSLIRRTLWFLGLFHVSIVEFEVDFRKTVRFACVISELVGGLPDLRSFLFLVFWREECEARFYGYQHPVGSTGNPSIGARIDEVMGQKPDFGSVGFWLGF